VRRDRNTDPTKPAPVAGFVFLRWLDQVDWIRPTIPDSAQPFDDFDPLQVQHEMDHKAFMRGAIFSAFMLLAGCDFSSQTDNQFGDQHFKTAISLIELHKQRTGHYPASLKELQFIGDWDNIAIGSVQYRQMGEGYSLDVVRGWVGSPQLTYPPEFWRGLGILSTNVGGLSADLNGAKRVPEDQNSTGSSESSRQGGSIN
jgi:hypothetical protein